MSTAQITQGTAPFSVLDPRFGTVDAARIGGCETATLLSWRRKYGLLGGSKRGDRPNDPKTYTLLDLCVVRFVTTLIRSGMATRQAVLLSGGMDAPQEVDILIRGMFNAIVCGNESFCFQGFRAPCPGESLGNCFVQLKPGETVEHLLSRTYGTGMLHVVDMRAIVHHVLNAIGVKFDAWHPV